MLGDLEHPDGLARLGEDWMIESSHLSCITVMNDDETAEDTHEDTSYIPPEVSRLNW